MVDEGEVSLARELREPDREGDGGGVAPALPGREDHAEHLADAASRETVVRGARRDAVHVHEARLTSACVATETESSSLATQLAELASRTPGDTRVERLRSILEKRIKS